MVFVLFSCKIGKPNWETKLENQLKSNSIIMMKNFITVNYRSSIFSVFSLMLLLIFLGCSENLIEDDDILTSAVSDVTSFSRTSFTTSAKTI